MDVKRYHQIFDISNCNKNINNIVFLKNILNKIATSVDMHIIKGPIAAKGLPENPGYSVLCIIDYSHISIHTFVKCNSALIDIFSCKKWDREKVEVLLLEAFSTKNSEVRNKEVWWG